MKLLLKINLVVLLAFALGLVPAALLGRKLLHENARAEVEQNARLMMQTALAMRTYTVKQIKPLLAPRLETEFLPQTVPAFAATEIFNDLKASHPEYTYKEATLNPTNPRDRTVEWEADVVNLFRNDAKKTEHIGERDGVGGRSLFLARPIRITDANCLACHTTAEMAPAPMVAAYGPNNGFGWKLNEVVGAQIMQVPMSVPVAAAERAFRTLLVALGATFAGALVVLNLMLHLVVVRPIRRLAHMADEVSVGKLDMPDLPVRGSDEVAMLASSFNRMRISLSKALRMLEEE